MSTASVYLLDMPGRSAITLSQDELRSLLGQIEIKLHRSQVYRRIVDRLETLLGDSGEQAKVLCKALGREAIGLAFQQFAQEYPEKDTTDTSANIDSENAKNLSHCQKQAIFSPQQSSINTDISISTFEASTKNTDKNQTSQISQDLTSNHKPSKAELVKQLTQQQRLEAMRQIGLQLKQARESQHKSLAQLQIYTHIPIHQMEAVENGSLELLPEDGFVRDYIRIMGNVLGINGTILAASLPKPGAVRAILPSWCRPQKKPSDLRLEIRPLHLYLGYTALVAGAVGGLSYLSQPATTRNLLNSDVVNSPVPSDSQSPKYQTGVTNKPGIQTSPNSIRVGNDIAPPEVL
ncbi:MAG TPA: helix-turn-helix domain-containing protein [Trichormus sp. M33_DOE_039]|nr:helix-turn-helix domain-containing protein [Trichormus sp. M33_DOE_039]